MRKVLARINIFTSTPGVFFLFCTVQTWFSCWISAQYTAQHHTMLSKSKFCYATKTFSKSFSSSSLELFLVFLRSFLSVHILSSYPNFQCRRNWIHFKPMKTNFFYFSSLRSILLFCTNFPIQVVGVFSSYPHFTYERTKTRERGKSEKKEEGIFQLFRLARGSYSNAFTNRTRINFIFLLPSQHIALSCIYKYRDRIIDITFHSASVHVRIQKLEWENVYEFRTCSQSSSHIRRYTTPSEQMNVNRITQENNRKK